MESDTYLTIKSFSEGIYKEKGSRFIAFACPVFSVDEVRTIIEKIKKEHYSAKHHCYAYLLGIDHLSYRANDDGEPYGTAGKPILGQINAYSLTNILIVVVRYFGGKLLGTGGLINAYRSAAEDAIKNGEIIQLAIRDYYDVEFPYTCLNDVMKIIKDEGINATQHEFDNNCRIAINFRSSSGEKILNMFSRIESLKIRFTDRK